MDIVEFCSQTGGAYGDPSDVLETLTWIGPAGCLEVNSPTRAASMAVGLITPTLAEMTFPESVSLRYCPACRESDLKQYGMSYWRRQHQIPIVWFCADHDVPLLTAPIKRTGLHATFPLPGDFDFPVPTNEDRFKLPGVFMQSVANLVRDYFACSAIPPAGMIHASIISELRARKLLSDHGRVHQSEFAAQLRPLLLIPETIGDQNMPARLLKRLNTFVVNPSQTDLTFEALLLVQWLFGNLAGLKEKCAWLQVIGVPMFPYYGKSSATNFDSHSERHRDRCVQFMHDHPGCSRLDFTKSEYRSFRWLLHHDAAWLNARLPIGSGARTQLSLF